MKNFKILLLILLFFCAFVKLAEQAQCGPNYGYNVYDASKGAKSIKPNYEANTKVLFIVDFSNSMNEKMGGSTKLDIALNTLAAILPQIPPNVQTGLRVYGYSAGFTYLQGCMSSKLVVPLGTGNGSAIQSALYRTNAVGWTPITYSLKQAVNSDFAGVSGHKHIILLSDGGENCDESPCTYAIELMKTRDDISIDVIAFDIFDAEARTQLKCTALTTRGKFYSANSPQQLKDSLFESLNIDKEVKGTIKINP